LRREHENLQNVLRERQIQLDRSKEKSRVLSETNRDLQQVIRMLEEDNKANDIDEVPQLRREIQTLMEEKGRLIREKVRCLLWHSTADITQWSA
jgi:DnaJ-domain-containing protein 1